MQALADYLLTEGFLRGLPTSVGYVAVVAFFAFVLLNFIMIIAGVTSWLERRVWARIQLRIARTAWPAGRDPVARRRHQERPRGGHRPDLADRPLFKLAPYLAMMGFFGRSRRSRSRTG
jgi:NADH:ubiquinone oxidoreductase subunit H